MSGFADTQRAFVGAVLDTDAAVPAPVSRKAGGVPSRRFGVYRNNVYASRIDVLAGRLPVVMRLVGEDFFRAMARAYIEGEPPRSPVLLRYGARFPAFVAGFPPAAPVRYLADMASLEWAWHATYHAEDAAPRAAHRSRARGRACRARRAEAAPSLGVVRARPDRVNLQAEQAERRGPRNAARGRRGCAGRAAKARGRGQTSASGGASFIVALKETKALGEAAAIAANEVPGFELETNLVGLIASGAIIGVAVDPIL
jgi:hypothetical protein